MIKHAIIRVKAGAESTCTQTHRIRIDRCYVSAYRYTLSQEATQLVTLHFLWGGD